MSTWFTDSWSAMLGALVSAMVIYAVVIVWCRVQGVRSFAKMSSFDFAMTIAVGSVIASTALSSDPPLVRGVVVLTALFFGQWAVAKARVRWSAAQKLVDNSPILVMRRGRVLDEGLHRASMTRDDLFAKLREANALSLESVHAVVAETTGDVSVLHGEGDVAWIDEHLLRGIAGRERADERAKPDAA